MSVKFKFSVVVELEAEPSPEMRKAIAEAASNGAMNAVKSFPREVAVEISYRGFP